MFRQAFAPAFVRAPHFLVGNVMCRFPRVGVGGFFVPVRSEVAVVQGSHIVADPAERMDAVDDTVDGNFRLRQRGPNRVP